MTSLNTRITGIYRYAVHEATGEEQVIPPWIDNPEQEQAYISRHGMEGKISHLMPAKSAANYPITTFLAADGYMAHVAELEEKFPVKLFPTRRHVQFITDDQDVARIAIVPAFIAAAKLEDFDKHEHVLGIRPQNGDTLSNEVRQELKAGLTPNSAVA